ncbi:MAG: ABC transporter permease subunit, partial [Acidimicrobiia bacterium]
TMLAGLAGVLLSPILGLNEIQFTQLLVVSFAAAVVGRMRSLPWAFAGALLIGLIQGISEKYLPEEGILSSGFRSSVPFALMLVFLLAYQGLRREHFEIDLRAGPTEEEVAPATRPTGWRAALGPITVALVLFSVPLWLNDFWIGVVSQGVALGVLFLTFTVVTGEGGMVSLAQVTLAGIGAFTAAKLATDSGWPVWLALLAGALVAVPIGLVVAALSLRLGGLYLALATLAFSQLVRFLVFARDDFDNFGSGVEIARPEFLGIDFNDRTNFYLLLAVVFCVVALMVVNLRRSTTGLVLTAMRSSETAAATIGVSIVRSKLIAFGVSAFIAGLGGGLYAVSFGRAIVNSFDVLVGIVWLAIVVTWGVRSVLGGLMAGILYAVVSPPTNKLSFIFVIIVVFVLMGVMARLIGSKAIYTPQGAVLAVAVLAAGAAAVVLLLPVDVELSETLQVVPTLLFGLGAVFLARQPRGVLFDVTNRIRLRQLRREAHLTEVAP